MKWSLFGRVAMALMSAVALGLSMTACGGGTIAYLWATGTDATGNGRIVGYMVDDFTGNLTAIPGQPFTTANTTPVYLLVRPGGRFVYVISQGTGYSGTSNGTSDGIDLYAVGGEGTLTFEQHYESQGFGHLWAQFDGSGAFLYVLDKYNPKYQGNTALSNYDANGAITTFSSDPTTGRLSLVAQTASTQPGQASPNYLEVGVSPRRMFSTGNCLFTLNDVGQNITTYSITNGQLGTVTTGVFPVGSTSATSINGNAQYVFITDTMGGGGVPGQIFTFTQTNCALTALNPGAKTANPATATNPINTFISTANNHVYVLNGASTNTSPTTSGSLVTGFTINAGQLQTIQDSPFISGPVPQCMVEDPTSKFVYVANGGDGSITGYDYDNNLGSLSNLQRGSTFQTVAQKGLTCLAISGAI